MTKRIQVRRGIPSVDPTVIKHTVAQLQRAMSLVYGAHAVEWLNQITVDSHFVGVDNDKPTLRVTSVRFGLPDGITVANGYGRGTETVVFESNPIDDEIFEPALQCEGRMICRAAAMFMIDGSPDNADNLRDVAVILLRNHRGEADRRPPGVAMEAGGYRFELAPGSIVRAINP